MKPALFITATGTDIGKTFISAMIMAAAAAHDLQLRYFKPIEARDHSDEISDCEKVQSLSGVTETAIIKPVFSFRIIDNSYCAGVFESTGITAKSIIEYLNTHRDTCCLVEGAGGLLVPLSEKLLLRDLIKALNIPLLIVSSTRIGTFNHTLLTIEAALAADIPIRGVIMSGPQDAAFNRMLQYYTAVPVIAEVPYMNEVSPTQVQKIAPTIFSKNWLQENFS